MDSKEAIDLNLSQYLLAVKRHWLPAVSIFAFTFGLSIFAAQFLKPSYQAEGRLLFKNSTFKLVGSTLTSGASEGESGDLRPLVATQNPIVTQMEVISSRPLIQKTIDRLKLTSNGSQPLDPAALQAGLTAKIVGGSDIVQINYKNRNPKEAAQIVNTLMAVYLENDIDTSRSEAEAARKFMDRQLPQTQVAVTNAEIALRKFKQKHNIVDLVEESRSAVETIGELETNINNTQAQLAESNAQRAELRAKVNLDSQAAMSISAVSQSTAVQGILTQLQDVERQLATESSRFSNDNPIIISLKEKQAKLKTLLARQIQTTVGDRSPVPQGVLQISGLKQNLISDLLKAEVQQTGLVKKLSSLQNSRIAYQKRVSEIPQLVQSQRQLERQVEVSQSTYQNLLKKVQELQLAKNKNISNARIIASAIAPDKPDAGMKPVVGSLGLLLGGLLGTSAIAYLELRDRSLKTIKEVERAFGYTLLGIIPASSKHQKRSLDRHPIATTLEVAVRDTPQSLTSEMSRTIQANLRFINADRSLTTLTITSAVANEGKSKVAANLAAAIAGLGQRVLLIDADLRVPSQHKFWKLPLKKGLSELVSGKSKFKFQQAAWTVMENLDVITAGSKPANSLSCLESPQMKRLIQEASALYDFVIIDTPPVLVAPDALTVGQISDGMLVVARPGVIDANSASVAREKIVMSRCEVLGIIVNGTIQKYESEDPFASTREYFSDEPETEAPWIDYMTQLGETIADRSRQDSKFTDSFLSTTMLGSADDSKP
ncbi:polysaccharide biosynthesis tyrosine autokinase [Chamaesiphon sp. VAR_48_metabat_403]|uniref:GumC family protein n=1 Tax=Chamaesiphon sp. VAR_48_metabat_403 TaxID=2964700 RepID=UPI00286E6BE5|nr:polysaccharide biosynthesis tyrosine autokinase [Chamaesiphon sp. VAR_48_metabat_403]